MTNEDPATTVNSDVDTLLNNALYGECETKLEDMDSMGQLSFLEDGYSLLMTLYLIGR